MSSSTSDEPTLPPKKPYPKPENYIQRFLSSVRDDSDFDYESKTFDIDKISGKFSSSQRNKIIIVRDTITELEDKLGKMIPMEEIEKELEGKITKDELDEAINKLSVSGDIFKPRRGYISKA